MRPKLAASRSYRPHGTASIFNCPRFGWSARRLQWHTPRMPAPRTGAIYTWNSEYTFYIGTDNASQSARARTYFFNFSTAASITSLPTHRTSTLISSTRSTLPASPTAGFAPWLGRNWPVPGVSKHTSEYFPAA